MGAFLGGGVGPGDHERLHLGVVHLGGSQVRQLVEVVQAGPAQFQVRVCSRMSASGQSEGAMGAIVPRPARAWPLDYPGSSSLAAPAGQTLSPRDGQTGRGTEPLPHPEAAISDGDTHPVMPHSMHGYRCG